MSLQIDFSLRGNRQVIEHLRRLEIETPRVLGAAMFQEAEIEMEEAKRRTPVDTGALRDSGRVELPQVSGDGRGRTVSVRMFYDGLAAAAERHRRRGGGTGPAQSYAVEVHEDTSAFHPTGQAKFLESVVTESIPHMAARIAARAAAILGGRI